jgi:hypothetical protein
MENKINIAELLKDCPSGMELDCLMFDNVTLFSVDNSEGVTYPIIVSREDGNSVTLTKYGQCSDTNSAKCVIFPKGRTTWEGFQRPFKDGDIVVNASNKNSRAFIYAGEDNTYYHCYVGLSADTDLDLYDRKSHAWVCKKSGIRFATEEEKQNLFDIIKANGYEWDAKTKTLKKLDEPKFKVGDRIKSKYNNFQYDVKELTDTHYTLVEVEDKFQYMEPICEDKNWELVPNKLDISTLKSFDKVLVRDSNEEKWKSNFWGFYDTCHTKDYPYECCGSEYAQCIPYEGNEHLLGTADDCDDYYKTWE